MAINTQNDSQEFSLIAANMQSYLHLSYQAWFAKVNIIFRIKIFQRIYKCWHVDIIVIIKMAKPPGRKRKKNTTTTLSAMSFILTTNWLFRDILRENMIEILITNLLDLTLLKRQLSQSVIYPVRLKFSPLSWYVKLPENSSFTAQGDCFFHITGVNFPVIQKTTTKCFNHATSRSSQSQKMKKNAIQISFCVILKKKRKISTRKS